MTIYPDILIHHLSQSYHISQYYLPCNASLCSFRIYDGSQPEPGCVYIARPEQLLCIDFKCTGSLFLCMDIDEPLDYPIDFDLIIIKGNVDIYVLVNKLAEIFDYYNRWESQLSQCGQGIDGIRNILECSRPVLCGSIILADYHFNYVANTSDFESYVAIIKRKYNGQTPPYIVDELLTDPAYFKVQNSHDIFEYPIHNGTGTVQALCYNIFRENEAEYCARILFVPDQRPCPAHTKRLLVFLADRIREIYCNISEYSMPLSSYNGLREAIKNCLERRNVSVSIIKSILKYVHWNMDDEMQLLKLVPYMLDGTKEINAVSRTQLELLIPNSCAVIHEDCIIVLINNARDKIYKQQSLLMLRDTLALFLRDHLYKVGISDPFHDFMKLYSAYLEAGAALTIGNSKDNMFWYYSFSDYALDYILSRCQEDVDKLHLCLPGLMKLMAYDADHGTTYTEALKTFVEEKYSVTHAADRLFLHRTTFLKHLKKIGDISNIDLDDWNTRLHLMISFQLLNE